jgi:hypothetical protein
MEVRLPLQGGTAIDLGVISKMKAWWSKLGLVVAALVASLFVTQGALSAIQTSTRGIPYDLGTFFASVLTRIGSASEPSLLLILGGFLIVLAVRIRQVLAARIGQ